MSKIFVRHSRSGVSRIVRDGYGKDWYAKHAEIKRRDKFCIECKTDDPNLSYHVHHARPLSKSGTTTNSNLLYLCFHCHCKRHKHMHGDDVQKVLNAKEPKFKLPRRR